MAYTTRPGQISPAAAFRFVCVHTITKTTKTSLTEVYTASDESTHGNNGSISHLPLDRAGSSSFPRRDADGRDREGRRGIRGQGGRVELEIGRWFAGMDSRRIDTGFFAL